MSKGYRSGFVAIIGRPNAGKSTLLNHLVGQKVAIVSDKPQTTRNTIQGIMTEARGQVVFLDTPGIHKPKHRLGEYMVQSAQRSLQGVDAILYLVDATAKFGTGEEFVLGMLAQAGSPVILVLNKIDLVAKEGLLPLLAEWNGRGKFAAMVPASALSGSNVEGIKDELFKHLPEGPQYYPEDAITDHPERFVMAELIREKVLHRTRDEIPHSIAVDVDEVKDKQELVKIRATIYVERDSQRGIIIGKSGAMLKQIGSEARKDIEQMLGSKVFLELWVKVKKDWRNRESALRNLGYDARE
ncbi:MAG TPA: GTPase Era [Verrucomicrobiae bacterium]|nr:GTPase Era [Verrucomicrobiae bacterium]